MALRQRVSIRKGVLEEFEDEGKFHIPDSCAHIGRYFNNGGHRKSSQLVLGKTAVLRRALSLSSTYGGIVCILTAVSLFTRFLRLSVPDSVVFDELHFGGFMESLLKGKFSFDIHPWLGKLTLAFFAWATGYREQGFEFETGKKYANGDYYYARIPSAAFGSFCVPLMFLIAKELSMEDTSAILTACLPLLDNLLLIESRFILIDAQLMFYLHLSLFCALRMFNIVENGKRGTPRFFVYLVATSVSCAAAMSVKWTAGATPFLIAIVCAFGVWHLRHPLPLAHCVVAATFGFAFYTIPWYLFVQISKESTSSAVRMSDRFRTTLHGNISVPLNASNTYNFVDALKELHVRQFVANRKIKTRHPWESKWYEWPLNMRGIFYHVERNEGYSEENPIVKGVYLIQNPAGALWVLAAVSLLVLGLPIFWRYRTYIPHDHVFHRLFHLGTFLLSGYFINLLPYIFVERCYFLYHYLPALMYGQLAVGLILDSLPRKVRFFVGSVMMTTVIASFVYWSPWIYAFPMHIESFLSRRWMPGWD